MRKKPGRTGFAVADGWPSPGAETTARVEAVKALVANHTLIVGQSRSGKTNAARRLIEEILLWTKARVVILDPNADFRWLQEPDPTSPLPPFAKLWRPVGAELGLAAPDGGRPWGIPWSKLSLEEMAAFLRVSPKDAFGEYRHLTRHRRYARRVKRLGTLEEFKASRYFEMAGGEELERYRLLLQELSKRRVWAKKGKQDLDSLLLAKNRGVVVDLSMDDDQVRTITAARTLEVLWRYGERRRRSFLGRKRPAPWAGTLLVIDEAHLFAPPTTTDPQKRLVSERIERFADQGKKFNLYLMLVTQQPGKLNPRVLSECNNRVILRVNERFSLKALEDTYGGFRGRYDGALTFEKGEALVEGALLCDETPPSPIPRGIRFLKGRTREGGGTPNDDWARPKRA